MSGRSTWTRCGACGLGLPNGGDYCERCAEEINGEPTPAGPCLALAVGMLLSGLFLVWWVLSL